MGYWENSGKYQVKANQLQQNMPTMGKTNNEKYNAFIGMVNVYYDVYNNGGCNLSNTRMQDGIKDVKKILKQFNVRRVVTDFAYLESKMDELLEKIDVADCQYKAYVFWNEWRQRKVSKTPQTGADWSGIVFGTEKAMQDEYQNRIRCGFKEV